MITYLTHLPVTPLYEQHRRYRAARARWHVCLLFTWRFTLLHFALHADATPRTAQTAAWRRQQRAARISARYALRHSLSVT